MQWDILLKQHGQEHLLEYIDALRDRDELRAHLEDQLRGLAWDQLDHWVRDVVRNHKEISIHADAIEPPPYYPLTPADTDLAFVYSQAAQAGRDLLATGKLAALTVAGGQGTRLGLDAPKGTFAISPIKGKSLFQIFAETILRQTEQFGCPIPWYIMTSPGNDRDTRNFFAARKFFGLNRKDIYFFTQGQMPAFDLDGRLLMQDIHQVAMSPDGHGGTLKALHHSGALNDMASRGVEIISYFQVDNPLVTIMDPVFIGLHKKDQADFSSRMIIKHDPDEKIGMFGRYQGRVQVIEYCDFPDELASLRDPDDRLRFRAGSPAIHLINRTFVQRLNEDEFSLPLHRARKIIKHVRPDGTRVAPEKPNGVKLETFIFDALLQTENTVIYEMDRRASFAPVKNSEGQDSPAACRCQMQELAANWIERRGRTVPRMHNGALNCKLEISPRRFLSEDDFQQAILPTTINPGDEVYIE